MSFHEDMALEVGTEEDDDLSDDDSVIDDDDNPEKVVGSVEFA